jgi:GNAT superfamily N-acetyltransferase
MNREMSDLNFETLTDDRHAAEVLAMMRGLYVEDEPAHPVDQERFPLTIDFLLREPARGSIVLITEGRSVRGYAILIPYWSNEFGGTLLCVDELFVAPEARNRGIAHRFFEFLKEKKPFDAVAIALEVSPGNLRAQRLYHSIGFRRRRNATLICRIADGAAGEGG